VHGDIITKDHPEIEAASWRQTNVSNEDLPILELPLKLRDTI